MTDPAAPDRANNENQSTESKGRLRATLAPLKPLLPYALRYKPVIAMALSAEKP